MTEPATGAHLTTTRVNRLLRPLRNKCNGLAALPKSATASRATYSKRSSIWDPDSRAPLALLCSASGTRKLTCVRRSADEFELSRRINAVCDAFKNIVHVACGQPCGQRIPSLAAMCALVIGGNIPAMDSLVDSDEDSTDENGQLDVDDIYEVVPPHYRGFLIVSHALSMILCICTHHHALVAILLDHCLSFGLVHESTYLLNIILVQAFLPSNSSDLPPVTHPAHTNYLVDLHAKWTTGNKPSGSSSDSLLFTTSTFCQVVLATLSQSSSSNSHILWTSKVLNRLFRVVESCDIDSYITIIHMLSRSIWQTSGEEADALRDDPQLVILRDKLSQSMSNLFDPLFAQTDTSSSALTLSRINAVNDILYGCYGARLHRFRMTNSGSSLDLPDIIIVFAAYIFVAFRGSIDNSDHLLAILEDSTPVPTTFSKLMACFNRLQDGQSFDNFLGAFLAQLKMYSSALRSEKLLGLDASLWACALHHFESSIANSREGNSILMARCKQQLMEAVDVAERRCFGGVVDSSPVIPLSHYSNRAKRTKRGRVSGHWEWEDMVGSWIRTTPVHKKQKIDESRPRSPRGTINFKVASGPMSASAALPASSQRHPTFSPTSTSQSSEADGSDYQYETDKENYPSSPPSVIRAPQPIRGRSSNFFSLLADAQTNRIVLHAKSRPEPKPPSVIIPEKYVPPLSLQETQPAPRKQEQKTRCTKALPRTPSRTLLLSDDSLDLFAYATSSPPRC